MKEEGVLGFWGISFESMSAKSATMSAPALASVVLYGCPTLRPTVSER